MITSEANKFTLKELASAGVGGYRSLARWSDRLGDPSPDALPRRPGRTIRCDLWTSFTISLAARLAGDAVPIQALKMVVDDLRRDDPGFWRRVESGKHPKDGRELLSVVKTQSEKMVSIGLIDRTRESAWSLTEGGNKVLLLDLHAHARELLERLEGLPREEALEVA
jgi:hypothetical protein